MAAVFETRILGDFPCFLDIETALMKDPDTSILDKRLLRFMAKIFQKSCFFWDEMPKRVEIMLSTADQKLGSNYSQDDRVIRAITWVFQTQFKPRQIDQN